MKGGFVDRILTTNFDPLIARAAAMAGIFPAIYDLAAASKFEAGLVAERAVFHLHGQHTGFVQVHTDSDFKDVQEKLRAAVQSCEGQRPWIVVGYSGENDPLVRVLESCSFPYSLFFVTYLDDEPTEAVRDRLLKKPDARPIRGYNADSFFRALTVALGIATPDYLESPFTFLKGMTDRIALIQAASLRAGAGFSRARREQSSTTLFQLSKNPPRSETAAARRRAASGATAAQTTAALGPQSLAPAA